MDPKDEILLKNEVLPCKNILFAYKGQISENTKENLAHIVFGYSSFYICLIFFSTCQIASTFHKTPNSGIHQATLWPP